MDDDGRTVDFWFDATCPFSRRTARWLQSIAEPRSLEIVWRAMSLAVLNEDKAEDPEGDESGFLWIPARVCAAVQTEHGHEGLGRFYDALWTDSDGTPRDSIGDLAAALSAAGLPADLASAGSSSKYDTALRASHGDAVRLIDQEVGTPILAVDGPDGRQHGVFGPVLTALPSPEDALRLWDGVNLVGAVPGFRELKG